MPITLREIVLDLIESVEGIPSEANIEGVLEVFKGVENGVNNKWEEHLYKNANDVLFYSKTKCPKCKAVIEISRDRTTVTVQEV